LGQGKTPYRHLTGSGARPDQALVENSTSHRSTNPRDSHQRQTLNAGTVLLAGNWPGNASKERGMIRLGLSRAAQLWKNGRQPWKAVHVAGTNGKGSICAYIASMLHASGVSCGRFTSPHLIDRYVDPGEMVFAPWSRFIVPPIFSSFEYLQTSYVISYPVLLPGLLPPLPLLTSAHFVSHPSDGVLDGIASTSTTSR
jgi:hypothetical protein